jgi:hypothetical protein
MNYFRIIMLLMLVIILGAGCSKETDMTAPPTPVASDKDGTETLGAPSIEIASGSGLAQGGVGMFALAGGAADLEISVPLDATINQVLLYWSGGATDTIGDDTIAVNGTDVDGVLIGGPTLFYGNYHFFAYRQDITDMGVVTPGDNTVEISGFNFQGENDENNGATILVIYEDETAANIELRDGLDLAYFDFDSPLNATVPQTFNFPAEGANRVADLVIFAGSVGAGRPNQIKVTTASGDQVFDDVLASVDGNFWDSITLPVDIMAGESYLTVEIISVNSDDPQGASLDWVGAGVSVPVSPLYCLGDFVWLDTNGNGCQDEDEPGVAGVEVNLWTGCPPQEVIATTTTDAEGNYAFCELMPGDYTVQFVAPDGYFFCEQYSDACDNENDSNANADGITDCVTIVDADDLTIDAGLCMDTYCIGDYVWYDGNQDGCQDPDEMPAEGVEVNLWTGCPPQEVIATTTTDAEGYYAFCELMPGDYTVQFVAPEGYYFCEQYSDACDYENDSNANADGITDCVTIVDADDWSIDAALCMDIPDGCTRTIGYWKNHLDMVAPLLPIWLGDPDGAKSIAVTTTELAHDALSYDLGGAGNMIAKLYGQLLATKLNIANGADPYEVMDTIADADAYLAMYDWTDWNMVRRTDKDMIEDWKDTLDMYNNGIIGPGHCTDGPDDDGPPDNDHGYKGLYGPSAQ